MRIIIAIAIAMLACFSVKSQSQRLVLIEEVNNISAPISANSSQEFSTWLTDNQNKQIKLQYQSNIPETNPMFAEGVEERSDFYGILNTPTALVDGMIPDTAFAGFDTTWYNGSPAGFSAEMIENRFLIPAPFELNAAFIYTPNEIIVNVDIESTLSINGNLVLIIAIVEKQINFTSAPGNNGLIQFHNVFRSFVGGAQGITLNNEWEAGEIAQFSESISLPSIFNFNELGVIAFIQNIETKEIHQSVVNYTGNFESELTNSAKILNALLPQEVCLGNDDITPEITIRNTGVATITNCNFEVVLNGNSTNQSFDLGLASMEDTTLVLNPISFNAELENSVSLTCTTVNGISNQDSNNSYNGELSADNDPLSTYLNVIINTDCYPEETIWKITDSAGAIAASGGPYNGQSNSEIITSVVLENGCYKFEYFDSVGDGLHGSQWNGCDVDGNISVIDTANHVLYSYDGTTDLDYFSTLFEADLVNSLENISSKPVFTLFPNPSVNYFNVAGENYFGVIDLTMFNTLGKQIVSERFTLNSISRVNLPNIQPGLYFVELAFDNKKITKKLVVQGH